jgi:integral membrane protein
VLTPGVAKALFRYRVMAYLVGVGLLVLVVIGMPLQFGFGHPGVVAIVGPLHGFLYIGYLIAALDLARRARFTLLQLLAMVGAGFVPGLAFVIEHKITRRVEQGLAPKPKFPTPPFLRRDSLEHAPVEEH